MKISYVLFLALKNLRGHKMRTLLTAGGVAISVGFIVFLVSLGLGLQRISTTQISNLEALQTLDVSSSKSKIVRVNEEALQKFSTLSNVDHVHPSISLASKINYGTSETDGVVYGKNADLFEHEDIKILDGNKISAKSNDEALISKAAVDQLTKEDMIGKTIDVGLVLSTDILNTGEKVKRVDFKLKVVGIIDDKNAGYVYMPLDLLIREGVVNYSSAKLILKSKESVEPVKMQVENLGYKASSVKDTVDQINQFFTVFQIILLSFGAIAVIIACLGMFNTLTISLMEKTREVGFMKSLGTTKKDIYRLFIAESLLIGFLGSLVGMVVGTVIANAINLSIAGLAKATGNKAVEIFYTPIPLLLLVVFIAVFISFLTGLYPSRRAAKINPLNALRYE